MRSAVRWVYGTIIIAFFVAVIVAFAVHYRTHVEMMQQMWGWWCGGGGGVARK